MEGRKKRLNRLNGKTWTRYSLSVWNDVRRRGDELKVDHPAVFPRELVDRLLDIYTVEGDLVLDPFLGSGTVLLEAVKKGRRGIGLEVSHRYVNIARDRLKRECAEGEPAAGSGGGAARIYTADARRLEEHVALESIDLCLTSPPYWNILSQKRSADKRETRDYGESSADLSLSGDYEGFLGELEKVFSRVLMVLKPGKYCITVVMDLRKGSVFYPLHMDLAYGLRRKGFILEDIIVWDRRGDYNSLRPLGYPYVFRVNKIHEYIMLFQKPGR